MTWLKALVIISQERSIKMAEYIVPYKVVVNDEDYVIVEADSKREAEEKADGVIREGLMIDVGKAKKYS